MAEALGHTTPVLEASAGADRGDAGPGPEPAAGTPGEAPTGRAVAGANGRGRPPSRLFDLRGELSVRWRLALAALGMLGVLALWQWAAGRGGGTGLVPSLAETLSALLSQWQSGTLVTDFRASAGRIAAGYSLSVGIGVVVGVAIGSLRSVEATFQAPIGFMRYVPATALTPLLLLWMGIGEAPKITLITVGTVFFNILMVADVARSVPRELIEAGYTLGASRRTALRRIVLRHSLPGIIDVARINLAAGWLMLVVAELLAAQDGLAFRIIRAQRFRQVDTMFAMLLVFGLIGMVSDLGLRKLRDMTSPWARP